MVNIKVNSKINKKKYKLFGFYKYYKLFLKNCHYKHGSLYSSSNNNNYIDHNFE